MEIVQILSIVVSLTVLVLVLETIRRGLLKERYALLWLSASAALLMLSFWRRLLDILAHAFGFYYPPSFLFLAGFGFLHLIALHFSIVTSRLSEKNKKLAQELGIIQEQMRQIKEDMRGAQKEDGKERG